VAAVSRLTWFAAGTVTGVYGIVRARRVARNFTPAGISARTAALGAGLRVLSSEVNAAMAEREAQLRDQLRDRRALAPGGGVNATPVMIEPATNARDGEADGHR